MKKKEVIDLIRYHIDNNDVAFKELAYDIAIDFREKNDYNLANYIMSLLSSKASSFFPQSTSFAISEYFKKIEPSSTGLYIPDQIKTDIQGIVNAVGYHAGVNKFLFSGPPGTGKTEMARHLARILDRQLYCVNFELLIDSKLGQTQKNIVTLFDEINRQSFPENLIILFDEIDALALNRITSNDLREMGRATTTLMKGFDEINHDIILIATTNLINHFDKALLRRFDKVVDFSCYTKDDLIDISMNLLEQDLKKFKFPIRHQKLCYKILSSTEKLPYPGDLKNIIRTAIVFSDPSTPNEYITNLLKSLNPNIKISFNSLKEMGFSLREMEVITDISRSTLSRMMKGRDLNE